MLQQQQQLQQPHRKVSPTDQDSCVCGNLNPKLAVMSGKALSQHRSPSCTANIPDWRADQLAELVAVPRRRPAWPA